MGDTRSSLSRRALLVGTVGALGAVTVGSRLRLRQAAFGARVLSREEMRVVGALAEAMFPAGHFPVDGLEAGVPEEVDRIVATVLPSVQRTAFRYVLRALEWGTAASRGQRFSHLSVQERLEVIEVWATPSVLARRISFDSMKAVLGMAYFSHPAVLETIGWSTGCGGGVS